MYVYVFMCNSYRDVYFSCSYFIIIYRRKLKILILMLLIFIKFPELDFYTDQIYTYA